MIITEPNKVKISSANGPQNSIVTLHTLMYVNGLVSKDIALVCVSPWCWDLQGLKTDHLPDQ